MSRYPQGRLADVTSSDGAAIDEERIATAVADASAEIDGYIAASASAIRLPHPPVLKRIAVDIAVYRLMSLLPKESVEDARRRYEDAIRWLEAVAAGDIQLDGGSTTGAVVWGAPARVFDESGLKGFM